ncbi:MAG: hypothetical protein PHO02_02585 [Candidatus Nanoarchaeia archaeon]|nr:hypothetical protein [Candidatus Nanoarchaeia archaeon]
MTKNALLALIAGCSMYAASANADDVCVEPVKETEIGASAAYTYNQNAFGALDAFQLRIGGSTVTNLANNLDLVLDSGYVMNYYGYGGIGLQKDSLTDTSALLMTSYECDYFGGGLNVFYYDGFGAYSDGSDMSLTDYALGPAVRFMFVDEGTALTFDYSVGFGEYGNNRDIETFNIKNHFSIGLEYAISGFFTRAYTEMIYNYMPMASRETLEIIAGARLGYRFVDFMALSAFYEHSTVFGELTREQVESAGGAISLFF